MEAALAVSAASRVLLVEDDPDMREILAENLCREGYEVEAVDNGMQGLDRAISGSYELVILDVKLPDFSGLEICRKLREANPYVSVMMLTSCKAESDKLLGFAVGADDYVTKPFSMAEMLARVRALLRRGAGPEKLSSATQDSIVIGELRINKAKRSVRLAGTEVTLTATEFDLLYFFAAHPGRTFTREELLSYVWDYGFAGYENTVNVHINRLRSKIEVTASKPRYIRTVWGVGYRFAEAAELAA